MPTAPINSRNFTHEWLDSVSVSKREIWHDERCPNLIVRIGTGRRASRVFYWYGRSGGKPSFIKIGVYPKMTVPAAREEAKIMSGDVAIGKQPKSRAAISRDEMTLGKLFEWFLEFHSKPHKDTWREDTRNYERTMKQWESWKLSSITKEIVKRQHVAIKSGPTGEATKGGPYAANKFLQLLGFMWRMAQTELGIEAANPTEGIKQFPRVERERYLTRTEIGRFLDAVNQMPRESSRHFILLALLTGARRSNVCAMRWDEIDMDSCTWFIGAKDSKNKKPISVHLPPAAMDLLKEIRKTNKSQWVLPGQGVTGHVVEPKHAMRAALVAAGICRKKRGPNRSLVLDPKKHVRFHDLRRTLGSWQAAQGSSLIVIGKSLGHTSASATKVYARVDLDPVRASVERATAEMMSLKNNSKKSSK